MMGDYCFSMYRRGECGGWRMEGRVWRVEGGGWRVWRVEGVEGGGWSAGVKKLREKGLKFFSQAVLVTLPPQPTEIVANRFSTPYETRS
jgi:hypothetical protein